MSFPARPTGHPSSSARRLAMPGFLHTHEVGLRPLSLLQHSVQPVLSETGDINAEDGQLMRALRGRTPGEGIGKPGGESTG